MKAILLIITVLTLSMSSSAHGQKHLSTTPVATKITPKKEFKVAVTSRVGKKTNVNSLNMSNLPNGNYSLPLNNGTFLQFQLQNKKIVEAYNAEGKVITALKGSRYQCDGWVCTCNPDVDPADCDKMIDETGCEPVIDIDGKTYCIKKGLFKKINNHVIVTKIPSITKL